MPYLLPQRRWCATQLDSSIIQLASFILATAGAAWGQNQGLALPLGAIAPHYSVSRPGSVVTAGAGPITSVSRLTPSALSQTRQEAAGLPREKGISRQLWDLRSRLDILVADNAIRGATSPDGSTMKVHGERHRKMLGNPVMERPRFGFGGGEYSLTAIVEPVVDGDYEWSTAQRSRLQITVAERGAGMGDKGGKKDKEKNKQQQLTKHKQEEQKKRDRAPAKKPAAGAA